MKSSPILLLHYGDAFYMESIIRSSVALGNEVFLLGDKENAYLGAIDGCTHLPFSEFVSPQNQSDFDASFQFVHGDDFVGQENWVKFNFLKMIAIYNFSKKMGCDRFWLLDSDVLVTRNLSNLIGAFEEIDLMTHPRNLSPQGLVNEPEVFKDFFYYVITKFQDQTFLESAKLDFKKNPDYGLTYMRFWNAFYKEREYSIQEMGDFSSEFHFVPCLFNQPHYQKYPFRFQNFNMTEVYFGNERSIWVKSEKGQWVNPVTINLSWLPPHIHYRIVNHATGVKRSLFVLEKWITRNDKVRMHLAQSLPDRLLLKFRK